MATEISMDLINQLKVSLRKEAKLGDYSDSSFPSLPTSAEAIEELDASSLDLRCRNCKGKLLRGIDSLICVFCGKQQRTNDNPPDPIKFTSTSGYKWFLSSLNLDGSEMVEPLKETNESSRGAKASVDKEISVSKFLDLEIQWSAIEEKGPDDGQSEQIKNPLNLGGISLDDLFVEEREDLSKVDPAERKSMEDDFKDPRSLSLFDSVKSDNVVKSQTNESVDLFKRKDGQKNVSSEKHENLSLFAGRDVQESVSLAEQRNFGSFEEKNAQNSFKEDENLSLFEVKDVERASSSRDGESFGLFEGKDTQRNSSSKKDEGLFDGEDAQRTSSSRDDESFGLFESKDAQRNSSSKKDEDRSLFDGKDAQITRSFRDDESFGFSESKDAQRNSCSKKDDDLGFDGKDAQRNSSSEEDESFGSFLATPSNNGLKSFDGKVVASSSDWASDFQSADHTFSQEKISGDPFVCSPVDLYAHMDSVFGSGKDLPADSSTAGDWLQDDLFGNVTSKTQNNDPAAHDMNEGQVVGGNGSLSMDIDWIGDDLWQTTVKNTNEKTATDDDDDWNDFESSANSKTHNIPLSRTVDSSHVKSTAKEQSKDEKQNTDTSVISDIAKGQEDDLFGTWNSFTSSTVLQTPVQPLTNHVDPSGEQTSEMNLFGANRDLDSDFFSESIGGQTNSEEVKATPSGTSNLERTSDTVDTTTKPNKSKKDVAIEEKGPDDGQSVQIKNPLNLGGTSLDDFFVEGRRDLSKVDQVERKSVEDDYKDPRSLSLFDSVKSESVVESQPNENVGLFNGKNGQKNVSSEKHENISLFAGREVQDSVSLAELGNFGFFEEKNAQKSFKEDENLSVFEEKDAQRASSSRDDENFGLFEGNVTQRNSSSKEDEDLSLFDRKDAQRTSSSRDDKNFGLFEGKDALRNSSSKTDEDLGLFDGKDAQRTSSSNEDENFGSFVAATPSNTGFNSFDDKVVASSGWAFDFQSANHNFSQDKISGDPFVSSPVALYAHMDSVFGSGKDLPADSSTAGDWLQDDLFGNVTSKTQNNDPAVHDMNEGQFVGGNGSSSMDIDWIGDDLWQTSVKNTIEKTPTDDNDDEWNDFESSANFKTPNNPLSQTVDSSYVKNDLAAYDKNEGQVVGGNGSSAIDIDWMGDDLWQTSVNNTIEKTPTDDNDDEWNDFESSANFKTPNNPLAQTMGSSHVKNDPAVYVENEGQAVAGNGSSFMDIDWFGDHLWQTSLKNTNGKKPTDDSEDDWNDFESSANSKTPNNPLAQTMDSSHVKNTVKEQSKDEKQNSDKSVISDIAKGQEDDLFGFWGSFTSSTVLQTPVQVNKLRK